MAVTPVGEVLYIDDDPASVDLFLRACRKLGCGAADTARSAEDGWLRLHDAAKPPVKLILIDLNLPRQSGLEFVREVRRSVYRSVPILVLTTSQNPDDVTHSYEAGANAFVSKPPGFRALCELLSKLQAFWFEAATLPGGEVDGI